MAFKRDRAPLSLDGIRNQLGEARSQPDLPGAELQPAGRDLDRFGWEVKAAVCSRWRGFIRAGPRRSSPKEAAAPGILPLTPLDDPQPLDALDGEPDLLRNSARRVVADCCVPVNPGKPQLVERPSTDQPARVRDDALAPCPRRAPVAELGSATLGGFALLAFMQPTHGQPAV